MAGSYSDSSIKPANSSEKEAYERTVARLAQIVKQVDETQRGDSLKGKVAIITGVGSLKGIG